MDLRLTEDQQLIQSTAREMLATRCPPSLVRAMEKDPKGVPTELWRAMAELGWMGVPFEEKDGGVGQTFVELCVLVEELGRHRAPGPFFSTIVLCGLPVARFGSDAQRTKVLAGIAAGERIAAYAEAEPGRPSFGVDEVDLAARRDGDRWVLEGRKTFVTHAEAADDLLVVTRGDEGLTLFLIDARADGITREPLEMIGGDPASEITFRDVRAAEGDVLGRVGGGAEVVRAIHQWGAAAKCAEMIGGAERVLEMTIEYAKERQAFGSPIGSFQAVQHHCANMALDVQGSRWLAYEAIWRLAEGLDAETEVSMAKAWVSDAYAHVCALAHQVHGAIGFTREHDLQLYFHHARACELAFGDADHHRELLARRLGI